MIEVYLNNMKVYLFILLGFLLTHCGEGVSYQNSYAEPNMEGFSFYEESIINEVILDLKTSSPGLFTGDKPLNISKNFGARFDSADYQPSSCSININPNLTTFSSQELSLKYLVLHQIGKCFQLPVSYDENDIMYYQFNSDLIPNITEKIPEFSRKLQ